MDNNLEVAEWSKKIIQLQSNWSPTHPTYSFEMARAQLGLTKCHHNIVGVFLMKVKNKKSHLKLLKHVDSETKPASR